MVLANPAANPKSWPLWWRLCMLASLSWFVMMGQVMSASIPPMLGPIMQELHVNSTKASQLASWAILALGLGNIWAVPTVAHVGARYTILVGLAVFTASFFWQGAAQSYDSLLAARVVGGLGGGVVESMGPMIVVLLFPPEYLGRAMSVYTWALGAGSAFGPLIAGYMIEGLGSWRDPQYLFGAMSALNVVGCFLMFPDPIINIRVRGEPPLPAPEPVTDQASDRDIESKSAGNEAARDEQLEFAASPPSAAIPPTSWTNLWLRRSFFLKFTYHHPVGSWMSMTLTPFRLLAVPAVLVTVLLFGVNISSTIATSILVSLTFAQPPMLWSTGLIGLFNVSVLIGLCAGSIIGGPVADMVVASFTRRHGYHKPESALPLLLPMALSVPPAIVLVGVGLGNGWHWAVVGLMWVIINIGLTGACTILLSYSTDLHPEKAIDIGVVVNITKNAIAAGISFATVEWWAKDGWYMFLAIGLIELFLFILAGVLWFWGPKITRVTRSWTWLQGYNVN